MSILLLYELYSKIITSIHCFAKDFMKNLRCFLLISSLTLTISAWAENETKVGILIDTLCGETSAHNPEKVADHTVSCSLMRNCKLSGFGLVVDPIFFKFDTQGDEMALNLLESSQKRRNVEVKVTGIFNPQEGTVLVGKLVPSGDK